jgi:large subunit ribosomal protein L24
MTTVKRIKKDDTVKLISGANKGTTGKVIAVLPKKNAVLIEGIGNIHRNVKPSRQNPRGGQRDIHVPIQIHKIALVIDEKTSKTSRVGLIKNADDKTARIARQNNDKEIK